MNRDDYLARIDERLRFLTDPERIDIRSDLEELYEGLRARGMTDAQVQSRIGSPQTVAAEYRLSEHLDRLDRYPGPATGFRIGLATLSGQVARGATFQLFGLVWLALALLTFAAAAVVIAAAALAAGAIAGYDPIVTTLAMPGIPPVSGALIGIAAAAAGVGLVLVSRLAMRGLSRAIRERLRRRHTDAMTNHDSGWVLDAAPAHRQPSRWIDSRRAVVHLGMAAGALTIVAVLLMLIVPAPRFPVSVYRAESFELDRGTTIEIRAHAVDVRIADGDVPAARLTAELRRTFLQSVDLSAVSGDTSVVVEARHREGLSWGINPKPLLEVQIPADQQAAVTGLVVVLTGGAEIDIRTVPPELRPALLVERR